MIAFLGQLVAGSALRAHGGVVLPDADHRSPQVVDVLLLPRQDAGVGHGGVDQREQPGVLTQGVALGLGHLAHDLVVEAGRRADLLRAVVGPEQADGRVVGRPPQSRGHRAAQLGGDALAAHLVHSLEVLGVTRQGRLVEGVTGGHREALGLGPEEGGVGALDGVVGVDAVAGGRGGGHVAGVADAGVAAAVGQHGQGDGATEGHTVVDLAGGACGLERRIPPSRSAFWLGKSVLSVVWAAVAMAASGDAPGTAVRPGR